MNKRCFRCEKQPYGEKLIIPVMSGSDAWQDLKHQLCYHCVCGLTEKILVYPEAE